MYIPTVYLFIYCAVYICYMYISTYNIISWHWHHSTHCINYMHNWRDVLRCEWVVRGEIRHKELDRRCGAYFISSIKRLPISTCTNATYEFIHIYIKYIPIYVYSSSIKRRVILWATHMCAWWCVDSSRWHDVMHETRIATGACSC